ncbi:hypothetical protein JRO89_XS01G0125800 [Xanthoceras sorbifolium]|uniref:Pentatricopeptide repeat-containing protein n=1 Tax=Xanthoceras sorbifolium TaxID=99658 RepID=A0ABQ8IJ20_9ROSI|nr:hypothetical protein JRO89_XS01G0125800 [Xanthoceras sorbifolium]
MKYLTLRISNMNKSSWKMTLIFCKSGQMDHAKNVLEEMLSSDLPINQGAYTSVVHWLCIHSRFDSALRFIKKMLLRNLRPGEGLLTLLVGGLCKTGKHTEAMELWFRLLEKGIAANTVTSNALIHGLCELGDMQKAVKLFKEMLQKSLGLDKITYNTLILSFCREEKLEEAFKPKGDMIKRRFHPEVYTYSLLLHGFYSLLTDKSRDNNLDQRQSRFGLARMIILHGYPLTTVEDVGFRVGVKNLQPLFELVTCVRIEADCMEVYAKEKQKVYEMLNKLPGKISLSADVWAVSSDSKASGDSKNLCLTAHYIDEDWQLKKTTFNFIPIEPSHTEDMHSEFILTCLMDWDIDRKLFPVTVDSGTSSDNMVRRIKDRLSQNRFLYLNGQLFEIRGGTNVVNLMVLRESNQYIRSPPSTQAVYHGNQKKLKIGPRCSGRYQITKKKGIGVYHLLMPPEAQINSVFYIAQLKIQIGDRFTPNPQLPQAGQEGQLLAQPVAILHRKMINREKRGVQYQVQRLHLRLKLQLTHTRTEGQLLAFSVAILHRKMIKRGNREVTKYLVQRTSSSPEEVTWKDAEMNRKAPNSQIIHAGTEGKLLVQSVAVEDRKLIKRNHKRVEQYLVLWSTASPEATTWEVAEMHQRSLPPLILEDKDHFKEGDSFSFSSNPKKSPRNFHDGVVGLGIVAAMNDLGSTHEPIFSAKSPRTRPISIVSSAKPVVKLGVLNMEIENSEVDELSESYTCVISHFGDNLVKKRVYFDDDKLENYSVFFAASSPMDIGGEFWSGDFLSSYFLCKKQLRGLDIFMYIHIPIMVDLPWIV